MLQAWLARSEPSQHDVRRCSSGCARHRSMYTFSYPHAVKGLGSVNELDVQYVLSMI